ncbi:MAG: carbohydrate ABC transporter permease [Opitutales bacterium]|nr:carbohydrate ABC transporter permease [Opitutales bacterium]
MRTKDSSASARPALHRFRGWWRRSGWTLPVHALLLTFGILNIYPFIWMASTSLKTSAESKSAKEVLVPARKYNLAPGSTPATWPEARLNEAQLEMLGILREEDERRRRNIETFVPYRVQTADYARQFDLRTADGARDLARARAELDEMSALGILETTRFQTENYTVVWTDMRFYLHTLTSFAITAAVVALTILMSSMLGYALAKMRFPGKMLVFSLLILGAVAPREAVIIPIFRMVQSLGLLEGLWGMILWLSAVSIGNTFLMAGYFLTIPKEVEESAAVDGAGPFRIFFSISLPMAKPIVMTVGLFAFLNAWNDFLIPLLCTMAQPDMQPLAVAVYSFRGAHPDDWHLTSAAAAIMVVPVILLFLFCQRQIVNSIAVGAVKG